MLKILVTVIIWILCGVLSYWTSKLYKYVDKDDVELSNEEKALIMCLFLSFGPIAFLLVQGSMILLGIYKLCLIFLQHMDR